MAHIEAYLAHWWCEDGLNVWRFVLCSAAFAAMALVISGCASNSLSEAGAKISGGRRDRRPQSFNRATKSEFTVYGEDKLPGSGDYQLDSKWPNPHCRWREPLRHKASTQGEFEQALTAKKFRSEYLKDPKVTVTIATLPALLHYGRGHEAR